LRQIMLSCFVPLLLFGCGSAPIAPSEPSPGYVDPETDRAARAQQKLRHLREERQQRGALSAARTDEKISRRIRELLEREPSLSAPARRVTISTRAGVVTLQGTVPSEREHALIYRRAKQVAGLGNVEDRLIVVQPGR
jgi:osmotically-inducible protein OsmY